MPVTPISNITSVTFAGGTVGARELDGERAVERRCAVRTTLRGLCSNLSGSSQRRSETFPARPLLCNESALEGCRL